VGCLFLLKTSEYYCGKESILQLDFNVDDLKLLLPHGGCLMLIDSHVMMQ
jgi:hypothetical protein